MAQWMGQFSGFTHETKVQDLEESLRQAVKAFASASELDRERKAKAVRHLSERLLTSRLKVLRARVSALTEPGKQTAFGKQATRLQLREQELRAQGIVGILKEFHVPDDICQSNQAETGESANASRATRSETNRTRSEAG
jgi:gamma-glutamyl phosphate reductase